MKDHTPIKRIFIDDRKSWTANNVIYFFYLAKRMYESGFACAHLTMKRNDPSVTDSLPKSGRRFLYVV